MDKKRLSIGSEPIIYGDTPLFDLCSDNNLMSLSLAGTVPFLDWIGWEMTTEYLIKRNFITYARAAGDAQGAKTAGWLADPCGDPNGTEWGSCDFTLEDFARLRRSGPVRDITKVGLKYCAIQPRYRLDGSVIADDREYDIRLATEVLVQDLKSMVIDGNKSTSGQFEGLQRLIKTGYTDSDGNACALMDSIVIDWNENTMDGGSGATWNGSSIPSTADIVDLLTNIFRRIRKRIRMSPSLAGQTLSVGDIILVMPEDFIPLLLDKYTCWSVCPDGDSAGLNTLEGRNFRNSLNGGMFGAGKIFLDGFEIPILPYDYGTITSTTLFDMYMLTGKIGSQKVLQGQFNDMGEVTSRRADRYTTDGGRLLTWRNDDQTCEEQIVEMQPRLLCWAPWAQARIADVAATPLMTVISEDQWSEYFPYP